jgi:hypothetical protein
LHSPPFWIRNEEARKILPAIYRLVYRKVKALVEELR